MIDLASKAPIGYVNIRASAHATEDVDKVLKAIRNTLPHNAVDTVDFEKTNLTGHYGNPITLIESKIKDKQTIEKTFEKVATGLSMIDKEQLNSEIMQHLEKGNLFLRLDKQLAYMGEFKLCQTDPIHYCAHFKKNSPQETIETCRRFGLLP